MATLFAPKFSLVDSPDLRIFVSFSFGKSSARMIQLIQEHFPLAQKIYVSANTGFEDEPSLVFGDKCDKYFRLNLAWVEAVVHEGIEKSCTHRLVTFETASRKGEPFEAVCKKYGLPNLSYLHCTRELKTNPMYSYVDTIWERGTYKVALGIRADEPTRWNENAEQLGIWYPLKEAGIDKSDVNADWAEMPFNLELKEEEGNCKACFKKSDPKHVKLIRSHPDWYEFPAHLERTYGHINAEPGQERRMFRHHRTAAQMIEMAKAYGDYTFRPSYADEDAGCAESCEIEVLGQQTLFGATK